MNNLRETIEFIKKDFPQTQIDLPSFDFKTMSNQVIKQPKYLFRGECFDYPTTTSTSNRYFTKNAHLFQGISYYLTGIHPKLPLQIYEYSLYRFLRDALFNISIVEQSNDTDVDLFIAGIMQHYQFDTALIDLTSDINIAAHFACSGIVGNIGRILVIPTPSIENRYFDLTQCPGKRPQVQKSFVMCLPPDLDLKSNEFLKSYNSIWLPFTLTEDDRKYFLRPDILSTREDEIAKHIFEWYEAHILGNTAIPAEIKSYFGSKIIELKAS